MKVTIEDADERDLFSKSFRFYAFIQGGILSLAGIILFLFPKSGLIFLSIIFGLYILILGVGQTVTAFHLNETHKAWWHLLVRGVLLILVGVLVLWFPFSFAKIGMGIPLVAGGLFLIINGLQDLLAPSFQSVQKPQSSGSVLMIVLGALLCFAPVFSALLLFRFIGVLSAASGSFLIYRAWLDR